METFLTDPRSFEKDAWEEFVIWFDASSRLSADETIETAEVKAKLRADGSDADSVVLDQTQKAIDSEKKRVRIGVKAGAAGSSYRLGCFVTTSLGQKKLLVTDMDVVSWA